MAGISPKQLISMDLLAREPRRGREFAAYAQGIFCRCAGNEQGIHPAHATHPIAIKNISIIAMICIWGGKMSRVSRPCAIYYLGSVVELSNLFGWPPTFGPRPSRPHAGQRPAVQIVRLFPDGPLVAGDAALHTLTVSHSAADRNPDYDADNPERRSRTEGRAACARRPAWPVDGPCLSNQRRV
jgi:hypothetical protein